MEMAIENRQVFWDDELKQNLDEHLETVFHEVFHETVSDKASIGQLLDPYAVEVHGGEAVRFGDALDNVEQAIRWAIQFGCISVDTASNYVMEDEGREVNWVVRMSNVEMIITHRVMSMAIVLAGVQFLRQVAYSVLNPASNGGTKH